MTFSGLEQEGKDKKKQAKKKRKKKNQETLYLLEKLASHTQKHQKILVSTTSV